MSTQISGFSSVSFVVTLSTCERISSLLLTAAFSFEIVCRFEILSFLRRWTLASVVWSYSSEV